MFLGVLNAKVRLAPGCSAFRVRLLPLVLALAFGGGACADGAVVTGDGPLTVQTGTFAGELALDPSPCIVGDNSAQITLRDAAGAALEGATVTVSPWMPAHGHGTIDVSAIEGDPGVYGTERVRFNMAGRWELHIQVVSGDEEGQLVATLEVP
ncbi:MAG: hypothetical protein RL385_2854 [Pseudomonadota bacterium]|jgi:hypothetical protein